MFKKLRLMYGWYKTGRYLYYTAVKPTIGDTITVNGNRYSYNLFSMGDTIRKPLHEGEEHVYTVDTKEKLWRLNSGEPIESVMGPAPQ